MSVCLVATYSEQVLSIMQTLHKDNFSSSHYNGAFHKFLQFSRHFIQIQAFYKVKPILKDIRIRTLIQVLFKFCMNPFTCKESLISCKEYIQGTFLCHSPNHLSNHETADVWMNNQIIMI